MDVLQFSPLIKRAIWGGSRLERDLGKATGGVPDAAESWEVCDLPGNVSIVAAGALAGTSLRELMQQSAAELLGRHRNRTRFPLLIKFLDAQEHLSVQVHPKYPVQMQDGSWQPGKTESWIVLSAEPESQMHLGLRPGIGEEELRDAVRTGDFESCLHSYSPKVGDCIHLPPGTVHALGGGLLVAEIQQPSDITYRFYDWDRTDSQGRSRELHVEQSFAATNFEIGPIHPVEPRPVPGNSNSEILVHCPEYIVLRHLGPSRLALPDDDRMHILMILKGTATQRDHQLNRGQTVVVPAFRKDSVWELSEDAIILDSFLPD